MLAQFVAIGASVNALTSGAISRTAGAAGLAVVRAQCSLVGAIPHGVLTRGVPLPLSYRGTGRERLQHLKAILQSGSVSGQVLGFAFRIFVFVSFLSCLVLFVLFFVLFYCLMHASVCISSSEALTSLTSTLQTLIEINSFDQLVTKTYPQFRQFIR